MTRRARTTVFLAAAALLAVGLTWGLLGMPDIGDARPSAGMLVNRIAIASTGATNAVAAVLFDVRALDALGEELLLFAAVSGATLLLRATREEREGEPIEQAPGRSIAPLSPLLHLSGIVVAGGAVLLGASLILHGHLTPGGGFQGGVVLSTALLVLYVADDVRTYERVTSVRVTETLEGLGAAMLILLGFAGMALGAAFLANVLPLGVPGTLVSSGTVALLNIAAGTEVTAAFVLLVTEFLEQALMVRRRA